MDCKTAPNLSSFALDAEARHSLDPLSAVAGGCTEFPDDPSLGVCGGLHLGCEYPDDMPAAL